MRSRPLRLASVLAALLLSWSATSRADVIFGLNNVVFDDGGTASGVFDIDTYGYPGAPQDIVTTAGTVFASSTYDGTPGTLALDSFTTLVFYSGQTELDLTFATPFNTNIAEQDALLLGGTSYEKCDAFGGCIWGSETVADGTVRDILSGDAQVPEPASFALLGVALFGIGMTQRMTRVR